MTAVAMPRIIAPCRSRDDILAGATIRGGHVWASCHNCGGSGDYPSSMSPPGRCRLYCWRNRTPETFGRLPVEVDKYVKRQQASDRRAYRARLKWEADAPARDQAAREAAEREAAAAIIRQVAEAAEAARKAISQPVGAIGERLEITGTVERVRSFKQPAYMGHYEITRYVVTLRDDAGNALVWFGDSKPEEFARVTIRGTVKEHGSYEGERHTTLQRVRVSEP